MGFFELPENSEMEKKMKKNSHLKTTFIRVQILIVALSTTTSSLQKCFSGTSRKIIYPNLWN
jgi:hypothetical protein